MTRAKNFQFLKKIDIFIFSSFPIIIRISGFYIKIVFIFSVPHLIADDIIAMMCCFIKQHIQSNRFLYNYIMATTTQLSPSRFTSNQQQQEDHLIFDFDLFLSSARNGETENVSNSQQHNLYFSLFYVYTQQLSIQANGTIIV